MTKLLFDRIERAIPIAAVIISLAMLYLDQSTDRICTFFLAALLFIGYQAILETQKSRVNKEELDVFRNEWEIRRRELWDGLRTMQQHKIEVDKALADLTLDTRNQISSISKAISVRQLGL